MDNVAAQLGITAEKLAILAVDADGSQATAPDTRLKKEEREPDYSKTTWITDRVRERTIQKVMSGGPILSRGDVEIILDRSIDTFAKYYDPAKCKPPTFLGLLVRQGVVRWLEREAGKKPSSANESVSLQSLPDQARRGKKPSSANEFVSLQSLPDQAHPAWKSDKLGPPQLLIITESPEPELSDQAKLARSFIASLSAEQRQFIEDPRVLMARGEMIPSEVADELQKSQELLRQWKRRILRKFAALLMTNGYEVPSGDSQ